MLKKQKITAMILLALIVVASPLLPQFARTASAVSYTNDYGAVQRIKAYDGYNLLGRCMTSSANTLEIQQGDAANTDDWVINGHSNNRVSVTPNIVVPAYYDVQGDGDLGYNEFNCADFFGVYAEALGITENPSVFLANAGYVFTSGSSTAVFQGCSVTNGDNGGGPQRSNSQLTCLRQAIRTSLEIVSAPGWDTQMEYYKNWLILNANAGGSQPGGCYVTWQPFSSSTDLGSFSITQWLQETPGAAGNAKLLGSIDNPTLINLADPIGAPTRSVSNIASAEGGGGSSGWQKTVVTSPGGTSSQWNAQTCESLANTLSKTTPAYITWAKNNSDINQGGGVDANGNIIQPGAETEGAIDSCPLESGSSLRWLGCSVFSVLEGMAEGLTNAISSLLYADPQAIFNKQARDAANTFRNIALILVVIAGLFMVISQALGFEFLDAYTIRKLLPRLGVVMVGIALSWPILQIIVTLTNDLGGLIHSILVGIGRGTADTGAITISDQITEMLGFGAIAGAGVVGAVVAFAFLGAGGLISLLISLFLALFIGLIVLSIRQIVIFIAVILAPIAIALYVIPGGQKIWSFWKGALLTALFMYPLIMGLLGAGASMSYLLQDVAKDDDLMQALAVIIYFAPFFMLPFAFKLAGGLMSTIFSVVNDRNKGAFDRLKNYRANRGKQNLEYMKQGNRFGDNSKLGRGFNTMTRGASMANARNLGYNPSRWGQRMRTTMDDQAHDVASEFGEKSPEFGAIKGDDAKLWASKKRTRAEIEDALAKRDPGRFAGEKNARARADAASQILRAQRATNQATFERARVRAQSKTGTGYVDKNGSFDVSSMLDDINGAYGDDRTGAERALAEMRSGLVSSGQMAGQAGFGDWAGALAARRDGESAEKVQRKVMGGAIDSSTPSYALHGKPSGAAAMASEHRARIQDIVRSMKSGEAVIPAGKDENGQPISRSATQEDLQKALGNVAAISRSADMYATPANASAYDSNLFDQKILSADGTDVSIRDLMSEHSASSAYSSSYSGTMAQLQTEMMAEGTVTGTPEPR